MREGPGVDLVDDLIEQQQFGRQREHGYHHVAGEGGENGRELAQRHLGVAAEAAGTGDHQRQLGKGHHIGERQHEGQGQRNEKAQSGDAGTLQHQHHHALRNHEANGHGEQGAEPQAGAGLCGWRGGGRQR